MTVYILYEFFLHKNVPRVRVELTSPRTTVFETAAYTIPPPRHTGILAEPYPFLQGGCVFLLPINGTQPAQWRLFARRLSWKTMPTPRLSDSSTEFSGEKIRIKIEDWP